MPEMQQLPEGHSLKTAFEKYVTTEDYVNSFKWAAEEQHRKGSLWGAFMAGWIAGSNAAYQEKVYEDLTASNISAIRDIHEHSLRLISRVVNESLAAHPHYPESYPSVLGMVEQLRAKPEGHHEDAT